MDLLPGKTLGETSAHFLGLYGKSGIFPSRRLCVSIAGFSATVSLRSRRVQRGEWHAVKAHGELHGNSKVIDNAAEQVLGTAASTFETQHAYKVVVGEDDDHFPVGGPLFPESLLA